MDTFENYEDTKNYWFFLYLSLASMISEFPKYKAKNSDVIADYVAQVYIELLESRGLGFTKNGPS